MADQKETYGYKAKFTGGTKDPDELTIVGVDCRDDECPELADPRIRHIKLKPEFVESIRLNGVIEAIKIRKYKGDDRTFVVIGRHRVLAARIVNRDLKGAMRHLVQCIPDNVGDPLTKMIAENVHRHENPTIVNAELAQRMRDRGRSDADVRAEFGVTQSTVDGWKQIIAAGPEALAAVKGGEITVAAAKEIAKKKPAERAEAIADARGKKGAKAVKAVKKEAPVDGFLGRGAIRKIVEGLGELDEGDDRRLEPCNVAYHILRVVCGESPGRELKEWPGILAVVKGALKS